MNVKVLSLVAMVAFAACGKKVEPTPEESATANYEARVELCDKGHILVIRGQGPAAIGAYRLGSDGKPIKC